jgi:signal transduction histidine kinase
MTERHVDRRSGGRASERWETVFHQYLLPAAGSSLGVAYATGRWDLSSVATGLIITGTLALVWRLDQVLVQPRLTGVTKDWLRLGLEMSTSVAGHLVGAFLGLFVGGLIFDFEIGGVVTWAVVGGIAVAAPIIHGTQTALGYYRQLKEKERLEEQLRALATQAELRALKAQINPHFLFNTLNTIAQLTHTDPAQAEATIERLAEMFRYVLAGSEQGLVPLEEELSFLDGYLEIERARFGARLRVTRQVAPEALSVPVPSLILQPLVENAIQHGQGADGSIDLTLCVQHHDDAVVIAIADQGPGMPPDRQIGEGPGHGLRNVDERLRKTYGGGLEVAENEPRGTVVVVRVPTYDSHTPTPPYPDVDEEYVDANPHTDC